MLTISAIIGVIARKVSTAFELSLSTCFQIVESFISLDLIKSIFFGRLFVCFTTCVFSKSSIFPLFFAKFVLQLLNSPRFKNMLLSDYIC